MKNKITKLFFALLTLSSGSINAQEGQSMPEYIRKATNVEFLNNFAKEKSAAYEINYARAVEIAKKEGKPISGEDDDKSFVLIGYDEETEGLIYVSTFNNSSTASSLQTANAKPLHLKGIAGAGMNVGVWDSGVALPNHLAFSGGRYIIKEGSSTTAHGAHVAGTIAAGNFGNNTAKGFAYDANIYAYNYTTDLQEMTLAATDISDPIYLSNHSYGLDYINSGIGSTIFGQYGSRARDYDLLANNAPYYTIVFAAGNDRGDLRVPQKLGGKDLLSQGGVSKNTVVVAATQGTEDFSGVTGPLSVLGTNAFIAQFSNYGPTDDFRIKPDIAAKGVGVRSVGISGITDTAVMQGTSMAAPAVTGVFTLWQGYNKQLNGVYMKSASVRALMAHTAREAGPNVGPDFMFGWGLIDATKGVDLIDQAKANTAIFKELNLEQNSTFEYEFPYDGVNPLVVTIAWNDPAGTVTSQADFNVKRLVNDLDLRLINVSTNQAYYPWSLTQNWAVSPTDPDIAVRNVDNSRDNIEKIEPEHANAGNYKIVINHKGNLQGGNQDYSLIVSGAGGQMPTVSLEKVYFESVKIYPNPANDVLNISGDVDVLTNSNIEIFDISGKKIKNINLGFNSNYNKVDVSDLKSGSYVLVISKNRMKDSYKFIKK